LIPKLIHYCWFGRGAMSDSNRRCIASWRRLLPDYEVVAWTEDNSDLDNDYCRDTTARGLWSKVSNHVRLDVLQRHGGLYLDTDVEVVRRFDDLLGLDCFLGFQLREPNVDWINNAVIGARAGHPFLAHCLRTLESVYRLHRRIPRGPEVVTAALYKAGLRRYGRQDLHAVTLLPRECFYPYAWTEPFRPECVTPETYCVHHWEGTWCAPETAPLTSPPPNGRLP
jgi:mannosyltransferase OCH1-like enzyme